MHQYGKCAGHHLPGQMTCMDLGASGTAQFAVNGRKCAISGKEDVRAAPPQSSQHVLDAAGLRALCQRQQRVLLRGSSVCSWKFMIFGFYEGVGA